jgi:glyoxylase-like metal-dependent hydrolase (beta-lactamase superfamily II)
LTCEVNVLEQLSERVFLAPGGVNIGVILSPDDGAILVDTGLNDTAARKVLRELNALGRDVRAIVTTHGHADHFGGNAFVVKRTGARVWAPAWDETVLRYPLFQPLCLFAGADPPDALRGGFLLAEASPVDVIYDAGPLEIEGVALTAISLAGHSGNQMGIVCDDVFFCADVVLPERVLERYRMPYLFSVRDHLRSLERALAVSYRVAVPGHGATTESLEALVELNRSRVLEIAGRIVDLCAVPNAPGDILADLLMALDANPADPAAFYLLHPTVFAFLTYLEERGALRHRIAGGRSLWQSI